MQGKFVTFEGCEGVGKSRQLQMLAEELEKLNISFVMTREPGGTPVAEKVRNIILDKENSEMTGECEALLYAAARVQHLEEKIIPALAAGKLVICDRYIDSSYAYQGVARGLGFDFVEKINCKAIKPDLTLFLDLLPAEAFRRKGGAERDDRIESTGAAFHEKVYEGYLEVAKRFPERVERIDCSGDKQRTHALIMSALRKRGAL